MHCSAGNASGAANARQYPHSSSGESPDRYPAPLRRRLDALAAHEEAAHRILVANNSDARRGAWELDLHGLHATEAVAALDQRMHGEVMPIALCPCRTLMLGSLEWSFSCCHVALHGDVRTTESMLSTPQSFLCTPARPSLCFE